MQNLSSRFWKLEQFNPSSAWQQLMLQAIREAPDSFLVLNTPRGVHDTPRTINAKLSKNADQMSKRWHDWHDTTEYKNSLTFWTKLAFAFRPNFQTMCQRSTAFSGSSAIVAFYSAT